MFPVADDENYYCWLCGEQITDLEKMVQIEMRVDVAIQLHPKCYTEAIESALLILR